MAPILTIFGPNRSQRHNLLFENFSNERRHRGIVVVVIVVVIVTVVAIVGGFWVACIKGTSLWRSNNIFLGAQTLKWYRWSRVPVVGAAVNRVSLTTNP